MASPLTSPVNPNQSRRETLLQFAGVYDVQTGVVGVRGELDIGKVDTHEPGHASIPGRRTGSIWMYKKRQKFPYAWQKRLFVLLPTELRLRYFKEDDDALVACGCVDLRSLKWGEESSATTDANGQGKLLMRGELMPSFLKFSVNLRPPYSNHVWGPGLRGFSGGYHEIRGPTDRQAQNSLF